jgi:hypothetical protein
MVVFLSRLYIDVAVEKALRMMLAQKTSLYPCHCRDRPVLYQLCIIVLVYVYLGDLKGPRSCRTD